MIDFIALPARARISISYSGDVGAEGFLGLRKLWTDYWINWMKIKKTFFIIIIGNGILAEFD